MNTQLTENQISMLKEKEGVFTKFSQDGARLLQLRLIDAKEVTFGRYLWRINIKGEEVINSFS